MSTDSNTQSMSVPIYEALKVDIVDGTLEPGEALRQDEIANRFGVSKIPAREALLKLESDDFVEFRKNRGAIVRKVSSNEVLQLMDIRAELECLALKLAVPNMISSDIDQARGVLEEYADHTDHARWSELNVKFHDTLYEPCANAPLLQMILGLRSRIGPFARLSTDGEETRRRDQSLQSSLGVNAELIDYADVRRRFPSIERDDIVLGCHTPDDGWIDPYAGLWGRRRAAVHLGVTYVKSRVAGMSSDKTKVQSVSLESGETLDADFFVNTACPWVADVAEMTGAHLPGLPMCRVKHFWKCDQDVEQLPLVKDESGMFFRPEGNGFAGGATKFRYRTRLC